MRRVLVICCFVVAIGAAPAIAGGPVVFKASLKQAKSTDGIHCPETESALWKNAPSAITEVDFADIRGRTAVVPVNPSSTSGVVTAMTDVSTNPQFAFTATFKSGTATVSTANSRSVSCKP